MKGIYAQKMIKISLKQKRHKLVEKMHNISTMKQDSTKYFYDRQNILLA